MDDLHPELADALDSVPTGELPGWHGQFAEIDCINQALHAVVWVQHAASRPSRSDARFREMECPRLPALLVPSCYRCLEFVDGPAQRDSC